MDISQLINDEIADQAACLDNQRKQLNNTLSVRFHEGRLEALTQLAQKIADTDGPSDDFMEPGLSRGAFVVEMRRQCSELFAEEQALETQIKTARAALRQQDEMLMNTRDRRLALEAVIDKMDK